MPSTATIMQLRQRLEELLQILLGVRFLKHGGRGLDQLVDLDFDEVFEAVRDAVLLAAKQEPSEDELLNGQAAATIAAIWSPSADRFSCF